MNQPAHPAFDAQEDRIAALVAAINDAHRRRDFRELSELGNRLATLGIIANALCGARSQAA